MENKEDDIEDLFRERFENDEAPVSPKIWQNIKKTLPEEKDQFGFSFSQNIVLWSVVSFLLVGVATWAYFNFHKELASNLSVNNNIVSEASKNKNRITDSIAAIGFEKTTAEHSTGRDSELTSPNHSTANQGTLSNQSLSHKTNSRTSTSSSTFTTSSNHKQVDIFKSRTIQSSPASNSATEQKKDSHQKIKTLSSDAAVRKQKLKKESLIAYRTELSKNKKADATSKETHRSKQLSNSSVSYKEKWAATNTIDNVGYTGNNSSDRNDVSEKTKVLINTSETNTLSSFKTNPKQQLSDTSRYTINPVLIPTSTDSASNTIENKTTSSENVSHSYTSVDSLKNRIENQTPYSSTASNQTVASDTSHAFSSIENTLAKNYTSKDSLTKTDLTSTTDYHVNADSAALNNASLPKDSLTSSSLRQDSSLAVLDSTQLVKQDSVLTEASTKKATEQSKLWSRISIDLVAAALLTGSSTKGTDSLHKSAVEEKNKNDRSSFGYSVGLMLNYKLNDRFHISTGIVYNTFSEQYNFKYNLKRSQLVYIDSTWQNIEVDSINRDIKTKDQYSFISIPLQVSYTFLLKEKIKLSVTAGIRSNVLIKGVTYLPNAAKTNVVETKSGFNSISFTYLLALEAAYKLGEHTDLLLQPAFLYGASSIHNKASGISQKPYGVGITVGLRFTF